MGSRQSAFRRIFSVAVIVLLLATTSVLIPLNSAVGDEQDPPWGLGDSILLDTGDQTPTITDTEADFGPLDYLNLLTTLII